MGSRIIPRMAQFGATTMIGPDIRLLLLDCFETIVEMEKGVYRPRLGIIDFLTHFGARVGIPIAVVSDASLKAVTQALGQAQLASYFVTVYHADNASEELGEGRKRNVSICQLPSLKYEPTKRCSSVTAHLMQKPPNTTACNLFAYRAARIAALVLPIS
jgi:hypothetical protein